MTSCVLQYLSCLQGTCNCLLAESMQSEKSTMDMLADNAVFYCQNKIPFVMGTTGGDRHKLLQDTKHAGVYAVIAPQMGKQVSICTSLRGNNQCVVAHSWLDPILYSTYDSCQALCMTCFKVLFVDMLSCHVQYSRHVCCCMLQFGVSSIFQICMHLGVCH